MPISQPNNLTADQSTAFLSETWQSTARPSTARPSTAGTRVNDGAHLALPDLESVNTAVEKPYGNPLPKDRVTRFQILAHPNVRDCTFSHPLSNVRTGTEVIVDFDGRDDPYHPLNWPFRKKAVTTMLYGFTTLGSSFASSVYGPIVTVVAADYRVNTEVSLLGLSMLLVGFSLGPLIWAPVSEIYGRKYGVLIPYFGAILFTFATGASKDIQSILITRFFTGFFGSAPITNTGGVLGDIWPATQRGTAIIFYAVAVVGGPVLGPIVAGAFMQADISWRWTQMVTGVMMSFIWICDLLVIDESYSPVLLVYKARRLRMFTGNWALHAKHEEWNPTIKEMMIKFGVRPFQMLLTPICFLIALYGSFVYGILYANLASFPIIFEEERGWNQLVGTLPFLGILVGILCGAATNVIAQKYYNQRLALNHNRPVPEARLPPMMIGGVFLAAGLFITAWTSSKNIHWIGPVIGTVLFGLGFFTIFQTALSYLIDTFQRYAASAMAANTFLRSSFAVAFPLFINPMYQKLGIPWATTVFACFAVALIPIPFIFYFYGKQIRSRGKYTSNMG